MKGFYWNIKMAWRDSRNSRARLIIFTSSIILGIATLVAIQSFRESLDARISKEAKTLLGADLVFRSGNPFSPAIKALMDSIGGEQSVEYSFASMIQNPANEVTRLIHARVLEGNYPFYGAIESSPESAANTFREGGKALLDQTVMLQLDLKTGDSVRLGKRLFAVEGMIEKAPGSIGIAATVAPPVYFPLKDLELTGLVQFGSRVIYRQYFKLDATVDPDNLRERLKSRLHKADVRVATVNSRQEQVGEAFNYMNNFLNLVGFIALLLGCIGVASAVHVYIKEKIPVVAVLRCLGTQSRSAFTIFLIQILMMGIVGSVIGVLLGTALQMILPALLSQFLVVEVSFALSWTAILTGLMIGVGISVLFAFIPLLSIRTASPMMVLSSFYGEGKRKRDAYTYLIYALIALFILGFAYWQLQDALLAGMFSAGIAVLFGLLFGIGKLLMLLVRKFFPTKWSYVWRQGLANLGRPDNQTLALTITIGLGTTLLSLLYFVQNGLIGQVAGLDREDQPNMVLFDIQKEQAEAVAAFTTAQGMPVMQQVPVVSMRLAGINGRSASALMDDTTATVTRFALNREYRVTYRDSLIETEEVMEGEWTGKVTPGQPIPVSLDPWMKREMGVKLGDSLQFNVQGMLIDVVVGSFRNVIWNRVQTNFAVLFPVGVLEEAPQFYALVTRYPNSQASATYQSEIVKQFPNISVIDLETILKTAREVLGEVSFVIRFMALFSVLTGLLVLIGSVVNSKFQRIRESVLLRTLGARKSQVIQIALVEYTALGAIASLSGVFLSLAGSWALSAFVFKIPFHPDWISATLIFLGITGLTVLIGMLNNRSVLKESPLEVLRREG